MAAYLKIGLLILLFALPAAAQKWSLLTESKGPNGEKVYWDGNLGESEGNDLWLQLKFVPKGKSSMIPKGTAFIVHRWVLHCGNRKMSVSESTYYNKAGKVTRSAKDTVKRIDLAPGSTAEEIYDLVCLKG